MINLLIVHVFVLLLIKNKESDCLLIKNKESDCIKNV